jgi:UDPglucose 6-dehydrogenase
MSIRGAEVAKIGINSFLSLKITYANLISELSRRMGLDGEISMILNAIGGDSRVGNKYFNSSLGFGGPSLPKSNRALVKYLENSNLNSSLIKSVNEHNDTHIQFFKQELMTKNPDKTIPFVFDELNFKKGVPSLEESQRMKLCIELLNEGYYVYVYNTGDIVKTLSSVNETYGGRLKFIKQGTIPQGYKIDLQ